MPIFSRRFHLELIARETSAVWGAHAPSRSGDGALAIANFSKCWSLSRLIIAQSVSARAPKRARGGACAPQSQTILLQSPIERAPTQSERVGGFARVPIISRQRFLNQKRFNFFQAHFLEIARVAAAAC